MISVDWLILKHATKNMCADALVHCLESNVIC